MSKKNKFMAELFILFIVLVPMVFSQNCEKDSDCNCPANSVAVCQQIESAGGNIGVCSCSETGAGITKSFCGDAICDNNETCDNCPTDCEFVKGKECKATTTLYTPPKNEDTGQLYILVGAILIILIVLYYFSRKKSKEVKEERTKEKRNFCPDCDSKISPEDKFCKSCGNKI